jgi:thymidylate synthase
MNCDEIYFELVNKVLNEGFKRKNERTGEETISSFGEKLTFDISKNFPLLQTKKVWWPGVVHELLWFLKGDTNIKYLKENKVNIWNEWADDLGNLGPVYGKQWRNWKNNDQIKSVINSIKNDPSSRRHIVSAWNVEEIPEMALAPCHTMFQFFVKEGKLDCQLYQRSADIFLGVPFNIASYSLLTYMIAQITGLEPGRFIHVLGDAHIYTNHLNQIKIQNERLKNIPIAKPAIMLNKNITNIDDFAFEDITLINYEHLGSLKGKVAI